MGCNCSGSASFRPALSGAYGSYGPKVEIPLVVGIFGLLAAGWYFGTKATSRR